jgi:hypothetical protein
MEKFEKRLELLEEHAYEVYYCVKEGIDAIERKYKFKENTKFLTVKI